MRECMRERERERDGERERDSKEKYESIWMRDSNERKII